MFVYKKQLQFPIKIATPNPKLAGIIISQYGGPNSNHQDIKIPGSKTPGENTYTLFFLKNLCAPMVVT